MKIITPIILLITIIFGLLFFLLDALIYVRLIKINDKIYTIFNGGVAYMDLDGKNYGEMMQ